MSQPPAPPAQPQASSSDAHRRPDGEADASRRMKHPRPPLPPPHVLQSLVPDSPAFSELIEIEQKLDWTLLRKKAEINDALGKSQRVRRSLRVFISNTAHDQPWQAEEGGAGAAGDVEMGAEAGTKVETEAEPAKDAAEAADLASGKGVPGWVLRIEGRLVDSGNNRLDKTKRKFSTFLRSVIVEFDGRELPTYPEGNIVEWHPSPTAAPLDGFEVLRRGDQTVPCRIILHVAHELERFKVLDPLAELVSMREGTRADVMAAVWQVVKAVGAQDKEDATVVRPVGGLEKILPPGAEGFPFFQIPELVNRFLAHPDPVVIPYEIRVDKDFNFHPKCFDIPVELEDPLKSRMAQIVSSYEGADGAEVVKLEDKVGELAYFARDAKQKRDFMEGFAANPHAFIANWLAAQARDLDQMLGYQIGTPGVNGGNVREEDLRRSDLFSLPWVDEAVSVMEAQRAEGARRAARGH